MNEKQMRRVGENEALFRQVNERLESLNESFGEFSHRFSIVCECGDAECAERIDIDQQEYARHRQDPALFIIKRGHETATVETVVERTETYEVVRKAPGEPTRIAERTSAR